jgi:hypothetical protein
MDSQFLLYALEYTIHIIYGQSILTVYSNAVCPYIICYLDHFTYNIWTVNVTARNRVRRKSPLNITSLTVER